MKRIFQNNPMNFAILPVAFGTFLPFASFSAEAVSTVAPTPEAAPTMYESPVFIVLACIALFLCVAIVIFSQTAKAAIQFGIQKKRENNSSGIVKSMLVLLTVGLSFASQAQAEVAPVVEAVSSNVSTGPSDYWGMSASVFFTLLAVIAAELYVVWQLYTLSMRHLGYYERRAVELKAKKAKAKLVKRPTFIDKMNASVSIEKEADIMLDHNYDGIHELDNDLPPWWKYGFYASILFSFIYMIHYHGTRTGDLQDAEYKKELAQADVDMAEYRKKAANLIDENNATLLTDNSSIASGKALFVTNCAACHGGAGEGGVGPNLTDEFWLHGGDIKDVFKTIKFGYPEKGMKSWQQDLGAKQIHEVASFVLSLQGTKPANAKEAEGEKVTATTPEAKADSIVTAVKKPI